MLRTTVRALACALMLSSFTAAGAAPSAFAAPGDSPYFYNQTTGWDPSTPANFKPNLDETARGDELHGQTNDWAGTGAGTYSYSWQRCLDSAGNGCTVLAGATSDVYVVGGADVDKTVMFCATHGSGTLCSGRTNKILATHTDTDGDGYEDYRDYCYQQAGVRAGGCPDYSRQPSLRNATTGGDVDSEVAAGDLLQGDTAAWSTGVAPFHYEFRRCTDKECSQLGRVIWNPSQPSYRVTYNDYGFYIQFCAIGADGTRMCSKGAGTPIGTLASHTDSDKDGVADYKDRCPSSAALTADGCPAPAAPAAADSSQASAPAPTGSQSGGPEPGPTGSSSPQPNGIGADRAAQLTAVINNRSRSLKIGFGKRAKIGGRLLDAAGKPIAGAQLVVLVKRAAATAKFAKVTVVTTDGNGRYTYIAPAGTSRVVRVAYYAFANDTAVADATDVTLLVAGALTLKAPKNVRNKQAATFRGELRGRPVPVGGVLVDVQVWFHHKWRTFATPRTNAKGAFRLNYRFTQGAARWTFRARLRKDSLYPYELGYSRQLRIAVAG